MYQETIWHDIKANNGIAASGGSVAAGKSMLSVSAVASKKAGSNQRKSIMKMAKERKHGSSISIEIKHRKRSGGKKA